MKPAAPTDPGRIEEAANELMELLDTKVGTTADWPIQLIVAPDYSKELCKRMNDLNAALGRLPPPKR